MCPGPLFILLTSTVSSVGLLVFFLFLMRADWSGNKPKGVSLLLQPTCALRVFPVVPAPANQVIVGCLCPPIRAPFHGARKPLPPPRPGECAKPRAHGKPRVCKHWPLRKAWWSQGKCLFNFSKFILVGSYLIF